jgi:hypothetical protein
MDPTTSNSRSLSEQVEEEEVLLEVVVVERSRSCMEIVRKGAAVERPRRPHQ